MPPRETHDARTIPMRQIHLARTFQQVHGNIAPAIRHADHDDSLTGKGIGAISISGQRMSSKSLTLCMPGREGSAP